MPDATPGPTLSEPDPEVLDRLREYWAETLRLGPRLVHPGTDLFAAGADSMDALYLETRIEEFFGVALPEHAIIEAPTPAEMEELIRERRQLPDAILGRVRHGLITRFPGGVPDIPPLFILGDPPKAAWLSRHLSGPRGVAHVIDPITRLKDLDGFRQSLDPQSQRVAAEIAAIQPEGPWRLMSVCGHARAIWQVAHILSRHGEVALLLLDPYYRAIPDGEEPGLDDEIADSASLGDRPPVLIPPLADFHLTLLLTPNWEHRPSSERWAEYVSRPAEVRFLPSHITGHAISARSISSVAAEVQSWLAERDADLRLDGIVA